MILEALIVFTVVIGIPCMAYVMLAPIWHAWKTRKRDMAVYRPSTYFQSGRVIR